MTASRPRPHCVPILAQRSLRPASLSLRDADAVQRDRVHVPDRVPTTTTTTGAQP